MEELSITASQTVLLIISVNECQSPGMLAASLLGFLLAASLSFSEPYVKAARSCETHGLCCAPIQKKLTQHRVLPPDSSPEANVLVDPSGVMLPTTSTDAVLVRA